MNCDKNRLRQVLAGESYYRWKPMEDMVLTMDKSSDIYICLRKQVGDAEINRRKKYLGIK